MEAAECCMTVRFPVARSSPQQRIMLLHRSAPNVATDEEICGFERLDRHKRLRAITAATGRRGNGKALEGRKSEWIRRDFSIES